VDGISSVPALACGPALVTPASAPNKLIEGIRRRLAQAPDARLWSLDEAGKPIATRYVDLWPQAERICAALAAAGVPPGTVIAGVLLEVPALVVAFWACLMGGYGFVPLTGRARRAVREGSAESLASVLKGLREVRVLADARTWRVAQALDAQGPFDIGALAQDGAPLPLPAVRAADPVCYLPTSGSTGRDRLACFNEDTLLRRRFVRVDAAGPANHACLWLFEPDSVTGFNAVFVGARDWGVLSPELVLAHSTSVFEAVEAMQANRLSLTTSLARQLAARAEAGGPWRLGSLERIGMGGETVSPAVARRLCAALSPLGAEKLRVFAGYGTTETGSLTDGCEIALQGGPLEHQGLGGPAVGVCLRIVDDHGEVLPESMEGRVEVFCPALFFSGYVGDTEPASPPGAGGWWQPGDRGWLQQGRLHLTGRDKDLVIVRGRKLALEDLDARMAEVAGTSHLALACALVDAEGEALGVVVFGAPDADLARTLRGVLGQGFGIQPARLEFVGFDRLPVGPGGKLHRSRIAGMFGAPLPAAPPAVAVAAPHPPAPRTIPQDLVTLWQECLPPSAEATGRAHFFEQGGDSLALQALLAGLEARFGRAPEPAAFLADPTLGHLARLVFGVSPARGLSPEAGWPLPEALHAAMLAQMTDWPGTRPTADGLMVGLNRTGSRPPLFWIFQAPAEFEALANALGPDQPLYGFRSGHAVFNYDDDTVQAVALRYAKDVCEISDTGPLFVGGNCQGGRLALAVADQLLKRKVQLPLLVLMEWGFELTYYAGEVLFLFGKNSLDGHPLLRHATPEDAWEKYLRHWQTAVIAGEHTRYFLPVNVAPLAKVLRHHLDEAAARSPENLARSARRAALRCAALPAESDGGAHFLLTVEVENLSHCLWPEGFSLGNYWLDERGNPAQWRDGRTRLPSLGPGESVTRELAIRAPAKPGIWMLVIDIVEEGGAWFDRARERAITQRFEVR
jgi:acyl-coenzyme A synthetase/AMP-(fatty) acid ligase